MDDVFQIGLRDPNGTQQLPSASLMATKIAWIDYCWFNCVLRSHYDKIGRQALRWREFAKYNMLCRMQVYCPDSGCVIVVAAARKAVNSASNLFFVAAVGGELSYYRHAFQPDRGLIVVGLTVTALGILAGAAVLLLGRTV